MESKEALLMLGERVRNARKRAKLSQTELGKMAKFSMNGIAMIERGESDPKISTLMRIADALSIEATDLIDVVPGISPSWGTLKENQVARAVRRRINNQLRSELDERMARGMSMDEALKDMVAIGPDEEVAMD